MQSIQPLVRGDNYHGALFLLVDWGTIAAAITMSVLAQRGLHALLALPVYLFAIFVIGARQRALATLLHEGAHGKLATNRLLNSLLATLPSGYVVLQSLSGYHFSHVRRHHRMFMSPAADPDYRELIDSSLYGSNRSVGALRRYLWNTVTPQSTLAYVIYLLRYRVAPASETKRERLIRSVYLCSLAIVLVVWCDWRFVVMYWCVPLVTTANWIGRLIELSEHYPLIETAPRIDIYLSRNRVLGHIATFFFGIHNEGLHLVHHVFPQLPAWNLKKAHALLMNDETYAALNGVRGLSGVVRGMFGSAGSPPHTARTSTY